MGYSFVDVDELEGEGPGGAVRKVRRALGARAFGVNYFVLPPGVEGREHDHSDSDQEEVYFVLAGSGVMRIDGERYPVSDAAPVGYEIRAGGRPRELADDARRDCSG